MKKKVAKSPSVLRSVLFCCACSRRSRREVSIVGVSVAADMVAVDMVGVDMVGGVLRVGGLCDVVYLRE